MELTSNSIMGLIFRDPSYQLIILMIMASRNTDRPLATRALNHFQILINPHIQNVLSSPALSPTSCQCCKGTKSTAPGGHNGNESEKKSEGLMITGWWLATPLKNMKVNGKDYPIYYGK
jgi:hypothetical protein